MCRFAASVLSHKRASEPWMVHIDWCTAKNHALHKLIDYLHVREQMNYTCSLTEGKQSVTKPAEKKPLDPEAALFAPSTSKSKNTQSKD